METPPLDRITFRDIQDLVDQDILGTELAPTERYWHWPVDKPEKLPAEFQGDYEKYGEIRWYG